MSIDHIGALTAGHLGKRIRIPDLHQPGTDWDAPKVAIEGTLDSLASARSWGGPQCWVKLSPRSAALDTPLPLSWPCEVLS